MAADLSDLRRTFGRSVVAAGDLPRGHCLSEADLALKKPGTGIPANQWNAVVGRTLKRAVATDTLLSEDDFE
jgi:N-acetylneuraminate synthase